MISFDIENLPFQYCNHMSDCSIGTCDWDWKVCHYCAVQVADTAVLAVAAHCSCDGCDWATGINVYS